MDNWASKMHVSEQTSEDSGDKDSDPSAAKDDSLAFLKSLAEVSAVFVGLTFIGGWSYLASYYRTFGLNALELDLSLPVVCTTSVYVLLNAGWPLLVIAGLWLSCFLFRRFLRRFRRIATVLGLTVLLVAVPFAGALYGRQRAFNDMLTDSSGLPDVAFSSKLTRTDQPNCVDHETYGSSDCRLLLHSKGTYYFFMPISTSKDAIRNVGSLNVYTLADSDVTGVHISRGL